MYNIKKVTGDEEFYLNNHGAKIYKDPSKHKNLEIPRVEPNNSGKIYNVLAVGRLPTNNYNVTVRENNQTTVYNIPIEYHSWVMNCISLSMNGMNQFPCRVEFGYNIRNSLYYAEFI